MRILFCNYEYPPLGGGGGVVNAALARELAQRHSVTVLTSHGLALPSESVDGGVRIIRVPVFFRRRHTVANFPSMLAYMVTGSIRGRRLVHSEGFDLINTHFALPSGPVGALMSRAGRIPNVLSVHGGDLYDPSKRSSAHRHAILRASVRRLALDADAVVAQSKDTQDNLRRFFAPEVHAHVIPLGIAEPPKVHATRAKYGFAEDDMLLISIGRLVKRKSVEQLLQVVAELRDRRVKLLLVGAGPRLRELRERARLLGVEEQVYFAGMVDETMKFELLSLADVYVSASQHEGFGLVFLEAMASGLPIVCYDRGGQRDFLLDGQSGYLVPVNNRAALVDRCKCLLAAPERRATIGRSNRSAAREFMIDRCARRYEEVFEGVLRASTRTAPAASAEREIAESAK